MSTQGQRCRLLWGKPQADRTPAPNTAMLPSQVRLQREAAAPGSAAAPAMAAPGGGAAAASGGAPASAGGAAGAPPNFFALPPGGMYGAPMGAAALYPSMDPQAQGTRGQLGKRGPGGGPDGESAAHFPCLLIFPASASCYIREPPTIHDNVCISALKPLVLHLLCQGQDDAHAIMALLQATISAPDLANPSGRVLMEGHTLTSF